MKQSPERRLSEFERYLTVWVAVCIAGGILLGRVAPGYFVVSKLLELSYHDAAPASLIGDNR
jgi:ACR3 family arsenite efflux pump ArsB